MERIVLEELLAEIRARLMVRSSLSAARSNDHYVLRDLLAKYGYVRQ